MKVFRSLAEMEPLVGQEVAVSDWIDVTQERIQLFAEATNDHQWIHLDAEQAKAGPRHDHRARLPDAVAAARDERLGVPRRGHANGRELRLEQGALPGAGAEPAAGCGGGSSSSSSEPLDGGAQVTMEVTMEREGSDKPVCVAESLGRRFV